MKFLASFVIILSSIELLYLGFRFEVLFIVIARAMSLLKLIGLDMKPGWIIGMEITAVVVYLLYTILFKSSLLWGNLIVMIVVGALVLLVQAWDNYNYVYVEEDYFGEED